MQPVIDVDKFVQTRENEIIHLVNTALNRAGDIVQQKVAQGEINPSIQEVLPVLLYEMLLTNTVSTLRLAADMVNDARDGL